jgi:hypothetical protein
MIIFARKSFFRYLFIIIFEVVENTQGVSKEKMKNIVPKSQKK